MKLSHKSSICRDSVHVSYQNICSYPFHWHSGIEILYLESGQLTVEVHKEPAKLSVIHMQAGDVHAICKDEIHRIYSDGNNNKVTMLYIEQERVRRIIKDADSLEFDYISVTEGYSEEQEKEKLVEYIISIAREIAEDGEANSEDFTQRFDGFLIWFVDTYETINRKLRRKKKNIRYYDRLVSITDYIIEHSSDKNILTDISNKEYLNSDYISHDLKDKLGYNFQELVNFYRVEKAIRLLLDTDFNIAEISTECGFSATRYMYKEFKKFYGEGPLQFRKTYQDKKPEVIMISGEPVKGIPSDELRKLKQLYDEGVINHDDFEAAKKRLLGI